jgi:hypothetical protein
MKSPGLTGLILTTNLEPFSKPPQIRHMNEVQMNQIWGVWIYIYTIQKQVVSYIHNSWLTNLTILSSPTHNHPLCKSQHSNWLSSCELQPITFNHHYISNLLVNIRYHHHGLSLTQWFCNPLLRLGWKFHNCSLCGWKEAISILTRDDGYVYQAIYMQIFEIWGWVKCLCGYLVTHLTCIPKVGA